MEFGSRAWFPLAHEFGARIRGKVVQLRSTDYQILADFADIVEICVGSSDFRRFPTKSEWNCHENVRKTSFHHVLVLFTQKYRSGSCTGDICCLKTLMGQGLSGFGARIPKTGPFVYENYRNQWILDPDLESALMFQQYLESIGVPARVPSKSHLYLRMIRI